MTFKTDDKPTLPPKRGNDYKPPLVDRSKKPVSHSSDTTSSASLPWMSDDKYEASPAYSHLCDTDGYTISNNDNYPSSWDDTNSVDKIYRPRSSTLSCWSDFGPVRIYSGLDYWDSRFNMRKMKAKVQTCIGDAGDSNNKCASDSNLQDALEMMEPGLRKMVRHGSSFTATCSESIPEEEDHIYCSIDEIESGFYSLQPDQYVTRIPINQGEDHSNMDVERVTVNGLRFGQPVPVKPIRTKKRTTNDQQATVVTDSDDKCGFWAFFIRSTLS